MFSNLKKICQSMSLAKHAATVLFSLLVLLDTVIPTEVTPHDSDQQTDVAAAMMSKRLFGGYNPQRVWSITNGGGSDKFRFFHAGLGKRFNTPRAEQKKSSDRYRFFHVGLGKRNDQFGNTIEYDDNRNTENIDDKSRDSFLNPGAIKEPVNRYLDRMIEQSSLYRLMQDAEPDDAEKRVPEEFSEMLYPIQAGKQELEVLMDNSLDIAPNKMDENMYGNDLDMGNVDQGDNVSNGLRGDYVDRGSAVKRSLDLNSPTSMSDDDGDTTNSNSPGPVDHFIPTNKRWWAGPAFNRFRSPKSSRVNFHGTRRPFDPVYYLIGLGK